MAPVAVCTPMPDWEGTEEREADFQERSQTGVWEREGKAPDVGAGGRELKGWSESATAFGVRQSSAALIATQKPER